MALSVTGEKPRNRKATVTALVAPLVLATALDDVDDPINDMALSGKEAGATVYAVTAGTLVAPTGIELRIATGNQPEDPWIATSALQPEVDVTVDNISDAGATGKELMKAATPAAAKTALTLVADDITDGGTTGKAVLKAANTAAVKTLLGYLTTADSATATVKGPVLMAARQTGYTVAAATDAASTATDVAGLLVDHNDLVSKYNTLRTDVITINSSLTATIVAMKAAGQMVQ